MLLWSLSLSCDVLQYVYKSVCWYIVYLIHKHDKGVNGKTTEDDVVINESEHLNIPTWVMFFMKIIFMSAGYVMLIKFIFSQIY